jgi:hypothetical protein
MRLEKRSGSPDRGKIACLLFFTCSLLLFYPFVVKMVRAQTEHPSVKEKAIEEYEREKLAKWKRNIGNRYMVFKTVRPVEFFQSPEDTNKGFSISKEKEAFLITEVVQNHSGMMNFYHVVFDSGGTGYLSADGNYLGIKIADRSILPLARVTARMGKDHGLHKSTSIKAIEMVKRHLIRIDPMSGGKMSVELRMVEAKARFFPGLKWRYEAREIDRKRLRVLQFAEGEEASLIIRTWIVDLSDQAVKPENMAAQRLYQ